MEGNEVHAGGNIVQAIAPFSLIVNNDVTVNNLIRQQAADKIWKLPSSPARKAPVPTN